jgi:Uma2 family endonuclease
MTRRITTYDYLRTPESNRPAELVYGVVREPPAPYYGHQRAVGQLFQQLRLHVQERRLGEVCVSPMDVVLDEEAGLIVQPDVMFISNERSSIIRNQIWGAPDLVVEVASASTEYRDRTIKLAWYRRYGVRECWLVHPGSRRVDIIDCASGSEASFTGIDVIRSRVLPDLNVMADDCCL